MLVNLTTFYTDAETDAELEEDIGINPDAIKLVIPSSEGRSTIETSSDAYEVKGSVREIIAIVNRAQGYNDVL